MINRLFRRSAVAVLLTYLALPGSTSARESPDAVLQELVQMLPGHYDNTAQVQADIVRGVQSPHEAVVLDIVQIEALMLGDNVFYVQESIAGDPNRVLGQKVVMFGVVKKDVVQTDFTLKEPNRWRNGQLSPDLFKGLMTDDVHSVKGCSLRWKRGDDKLVATNDPRTCHARVGGAAAVSAILARAELSSVEYATSEQAYDKPGHLAQGREDDAFYRFRKISHGGD